MSMLLYSGVRSGDAGRIGAAYHGGRVFPEAPSFNLLVKIA